MDGGATPIIFSACAYHVPDDSLFAGGLSMNLSSLRLPSPNVSQLAFVFLLMLSVGASPAAAADDTHVASAERSKADRLLTVDCLLPGQIRQLGANMTYLAPRHAVKTSAADCEVRGGEYVAYDRASYATALRVWQPSAEQGDKEAQTNIGEIYERGVGGPPDYEKAASWYRKAADQGYSRALINLGSLYEQGRGVAKDPATALQLYRRAAGLAGTVNLESDPSSASQEEVDRLRQELERTRQDLDKARRELDQERIRAGAEIERLTQRKMAASAAGNADETRRLEALLKERETELERRRQQVAKFEQSADENRQQLARLESESSALRRELDQSKQQLAQRQREIQDRQTAAMVQERELESTRLELARQKESGSSRDPARASALAAEIVTRNDELNRSKKEIARLENDVAAYKDKVTKLEANNSAARASGDIAPPSIQILDPSIVVTRDNAAVTVRAGVTSRPVVGRVAAPAGLVSLTANDVAQQVDAEGFFTSNVTLGPGRTRVTFAAVDRQSKRAAVEFFLQQDAGPGKSIDPAKKDASGLNLGNYYALLIGNQKYQNLRQLNSPEADVKVIGDLLRDRYGFKVTTLVNATRYQILTEMNRYMETLTERDNLLIYYAGHGEIDEATQVAFWLPVDADPKNDSNWISSDDLTRKIGPLHAKHVLVVADSCYSGVLTRSSISQAKSGATEEERNEWIKTVAGKKSRHLLSSGGRAPVMDGGGGKHSVFAAVFIEALTVNDDVLDGKHLGEAVSMRVLKKSKDMKFGEGQLPDYRPIRFADNDGGEFLFPRPRIANDRVSMGSPGADAVAQSGTATR
jgi:hypothetical protein